MQIDIIWLQDNFRQFNSRYFGGLLPTPTFHIGRSRTQLGSLSYQRGLMWKSPSGGVKNAFTLTLSNFYDQTEFQFRNVLLHEMIHLSIASSGIKDTSAHGVVFRGMMDRFNREGWDIHVRTSMNGTPKASTGSTKVINTYLVLAIEMKDGTHFLSSTAAYHMCDSSAVMPGTRPMTGGLRICRRCGACGAERSMHRLLRTRQRR